jgi:hypothetical protein
MVVGFKGKAGAGKLYTLTWGDMDIVWRELCPCLNPLGSTGKRLVGPERSGVALRPFNLFGFIRAEGYWIFYVALPFGFVLRNNEKKTGA